MKKFLTTSLLVFLCIALHATDSIRVSMPVTRIVFQRDLNNEAMVPVKGNCAIEATTVQVRLVARSATQGTTSRWKDIVAKNGMFEGAIEGKTGWYDLELCAKKKSKVLSRTTVERVGVGEVFVIVGHSVAQGGAINLGGAEDDRVSIVPIEEKSKTFQQYLKTGDTADLPGLQFSHAGDSLAPGPFGHNSYFWSKFAENVAKKINAPVLIFNAAFGGTSLEHWAKSALNIQFEHGFVRSGIRMPYINLHNTLLKYIPFTGIRAILADQGQNDAGQKSADTIFSNYQVFMREARKDLGFPELTVVVNRQQPVNSPQVKEAQLKMLKQPYSFPGPNYDSAMQKEDRYDGIHLSESGARKAAVLWADVLTPAFFATVKPWTPSSGNDTVARETIPLYADSIPNSISGKDEEYSKGEDLAVFNVSRPTLTAYLPKKGTRVPAVIICPGGGYGSLVINREGHDAARAFAAKGIAAFVLKYRLPSAKIMRDPSIGPLQDALKAIMIVRQRAGEWNIDGSKVGMMGYSAGGHLAASAGIMYERSVLDNPENTNLRPDFLVLVYPVITMDTVVGHKWSTYNLLGMNPSAEQIEKYSLHLHVAKTTPPSFLTVAVNDDLMSSTMLFCAALESKKVSFESHMYSTGGHGYVKYPAFADWTRLLLDWMRVNKWL